MTSHCPAPSSLGVLRAPTGTVVSSGVSLHSALIFVNSPLLNSPQMTQIICFLPGPGLISSPRQSLPPPTYSSRRHSGSSSPPCAFPGSQAIGCMLLQDHVHSALFHCPALVSLHQHTLSSSGTGSETAQLCVPRESDVGWGSVWIQSKTCIS